MTDTAIAWFRRDLRLDDNPALLQALDNHDHVVPVYLHGCDADDPWRPGAASQCWLHHSLAALMGELERRGSRLVLRQTDDVLAALRELVNQAGATAVYWNRQYEPCAIERDRRIKSALQDDGIDTGSFNGSLLFEPWEIEKNSGGPFRVFTPFWKACVAAGLPSSFDTAPDELPAVADNLFSASLDSLELLPEPAWDEAFYEAITPGEQGAQETLARFLDGPVKDYQDRRDFPAEEAVSRLSTHLHFGEISPRRIIACTQALADDKGAAWQPGIRGFERELGWREFAHHILYHFPSTTDEPMYDKFAAFPWREDDAALQAWQRGRTGIPLVDAGMRELWHTGTMHNRVRMVVASFLTKNLLIHWKHGARWFRDTLIDYDLASNTMGWQWTAGCGADAAPYFRIFNPVSQSQKFDRQGEYLRRWVPELAELPDRHIHAPWEAPDTVLEQTGLYSEGRYPEPIVDLKTSRQRALDAYREIKGAGG